MTRSVLVLGAGMVGTCTALHLRRRGFDVALVDRREPGRETSYGNAGLIQREAVEPYAFPRDLRSLLRAAFGLGADVHYHWRALPRLAPALVRYWHASTPSRHARAIQGHAALIEHCLDEHRPLVAAAGAEDLVRRDGFRFVFRTDEAFAQAAEEAARLAREHGIESTVLEPDRLARAEPALAPGLAGAVHWHQPWAVSDPGELVGLYAALFVREGGRLLRGDATDLAPAGAGWRLRTDAGAVEAEQAVIALGPWSAPATQALGYRLPLFVKRGYHLHFAHPLGLSHAMLDAERGCVLAPMRRGIRLTTGAEFADLAAPPTPVQLAACAASARTLVSLGEAVEAEPWMGSRPCTVDMLPVMGAAPAHRGLWFNFGHAHQGFTLGPVAGRLLAELIAGEPTFVDPAPYSPARFG